MNQVKQLHGYTLRNNIDNTKILIEKLLQIPNLNYAQLLLHHSQKPTTFLYNKLIQACSSKHQCFTLYSQMCLHGHSPNQYTFNFLFTTCTSLSSLSLGQMIHTQFVKSGFKHDIFPSTALLDMYAKLGCLKFARYVFDEMSVRELATWNAMMAGCARFGDMERALELFWLMPSRNVVSWTTMVSGYSQNKQYEKALGLFLRMEREKDVIPNEVTLASVLPACANLGALEIGQRVEVYARKNGFFKNLFVSNAVLEMYAKCGKIDVAWKVFDEIGRFRNLCSWNSMIMGLAVHGQCHKAQREGTLPDDVTFVGLLLACTHGGMVEKGKRIFQSMTRDFNIIPKLEHYGCMVDLLGRAGRLTEALQPLRNTNSKKNIVMNQVKQIHGYTLRNNIDNTKILIEKLLQIPNLNYAQVLLHHSQKPTTFLYNKLIQACSSKHQCFTLYSQMCLHGHSPNQYTFNFLFTTCTSLSSLSLGQMIHTQFMKSGFKHDVFASTALLDMYAKLGCLKFARNVFDEMSVRELATWNAMMAGCTRFGDMERALELFWLMPSRNVVSWTTMVSGYSQNKQYEKALGLFMRMEREKDVSPNEVTLASVLPACANLGALEIGQRVEVYARKNGFFKNLFVCNAVLEMYAKCGKIDVAWKVFDEIGRFRNLCSWNSMIMGLAVHGQCHKATQLYDQMLREGTLPDDVTFVGLLLACTHGGMVEKGKHVFQSMTRDFNIIPKLEHYGCMVDLLGRAGRLTEAYEVIKRMPMKPDSVIWGTLLGACSFHGNVELAEVAAESLFVLEPWNPGNYVILSNIYASAGKWDGVAKLRKVMKGSKITKTAGQSFIEEGGQLHKFIVEDRSHSESSEIFALLNGVYEMIKFNKNEYEWHLDFDLNN